MSGPLVCGFSDACCPDGWCKKADQCVEVARGDAGHRCAYCASTIHPTGQCPVRRRWIHKATGAEVSTLGGFPILYADPPWAYSDKKCNGAAEWHYRTMENGAIAQIPVWDLAAADAVLFMWGTYPLLAEMLELGKAWGFTYKSIAFQWVKRYAKSGDPFFGLGRWTRGNTEGCFLFTKGKPKRVHNGVSQLVETVEDLGGVQILDAPITRHSAKPAIVREKIHQLMGADSPSIELFAREQAPGWECWGNEVVQTVELRPAPPPTLAVPPAA